MRPVASRAHESGSIPLALLAVIVGAGLMAVLMSSLVGSQRQVRFDRSFTEALPVADSGLAVALYQLNSDVRLTSADDGQEYERWDFPVGHSTVVVTEQENGTEYEFFLTRTDDLTWVATSTSIVRGVEREVVAQIDERPHVFMAAFTENLMTLTGANIADSYNSDTGAWCTMNGIIGSNETVEFAGRSTASTGCNRPTGRTVDRVDLFDWADNPALDATVEQPGGSRCNPTNKGHPNCKRLVHGSTVFEAPRTIDERLDLATDEAVAFIADALEACEADAPLTEFKTSVNGNVLTPAPNAAMAARSGYMDLPGGHYCYEKMTFDDHTSLADSASSENPVIIFVRGEIIIAGAHGGGANAKDVGCVDCKAGPATDADSPDAGALRIFVLTGDVAIGNQSQFAGVMYAPRATCRSPRSGADADIYGSLVCRTMWQHGNWKFHFDDALAGQGTGLFGVGQWREEVPTS